MALTASTLSDPRAWVWTGTYVLFANLVPLLYLIWLLHRGLVTDLDVQIREQRVRPMVFTTACVGLAGFVLTLGAAPSQMIVVASALWVQTVVIFGVTLWWKISVHCTTAAGVATLAWLLMGTPLPLLVGVPLIAWSRVRLRRHTLAQTTAGTMLGLVIFLGTFLLARSG
jgi:membrane-associated phospholipid phosphatase